MKILFINTINLEKNGISTFIINNAKVLSFNNDVTILAPNKVDSEIKENLRKLGIIIIQLPSRKKKLKSYFFNLVRIIKRKKYDIVHINGNSTTMAIELLAAKIAGYGIRVTHSHNTKTEHPTINKILKPMFNHYVDYRLACSQEAGKWLYGNKNFTVINNGVNLENLKPKDIIRINIRKRLNIKSNEFLLISIGYFNDQKNQEFIIQMLPFMNKSYKLLLIGNGTNFIRCKQLVTKLGLEKRVIFAGIQNNIADYLSASDIFLMPSRFEGFPFALIEAQASGLSCIVSSKITKKTNLTGNVIYLDITNFELWANKIIKISKNIDYNKRVRAIDSIQNQLSNKGYDQEENAKKLETLFEKYLNDSL